MDLARPMVGGVNATELGCRIVQSIFLGGIEEVRNRSAGLLTATGPRFRTWV